MKYGKPTEMARIATMRNRGSPPTGGFQFAAGVIAESQVFARYPVRQIDSTREDRAMRQRLRPAAEAGGKKVGVDVAGEQQHLKEEHAGGPDRWRAAEPRQKVFSEDQLGPKEQESA